MSTVYKNNFDNAAPSATYSDTFASCLKAAQEPTYIAGQPGRVDGKEKEALDKALDKIGIPKERRKYTYEYTELPAAMDTEDRRHVGLTFWMPDRGWVSSVQPQRVRKLAPQYGCGEEEYKQFEAIHELVHDNCANGGLDPRNEELYARLAQAFYRPQLVLQASLVAAALATAKKTFPENHDFIIEATRSAIGKTFGEQSVDQFLADITAVCAEAAVKNKEETDPGKKSTIPKLIDKFLLKIATNIAPRSNVNADTVHGELYARLQENFMNAMLSYLPAAPRQ